MVSKSPIAVRNNSISKKERETMNVAIVKVETDKLIRNMKLCSNKVNFKDEKKDLDSK